MRDRGEQSVGDGEVSSCVSNLIHAFTDGLNVFKRLRERRKRRKSKQREREEGPSGEELQLSNSLRKGPVELKEKYENCYGDKGDKFAKGDGKSYCTAVQWLPSERQHTDRKTAIAHASLVETLIKFNTGLVRIIATFLHHDSKNSDLRLDYKSLTSLSDASRREALDSMNKLYQRLSQSQLQLHRTMEIKTEPEKKRRSSSRQRSQGPTVTRVSIKTAGNSTQTQLAMVRPRAARKGSSSSSSSYSSRSTSTRASSPSSSPPRSPLPEYSPKDPYPPQKAPAVKPITAATKKSSLPTEPARPKTWPQPKSKPAPFKSSLPTPPEYFALESMPPHMPLPFSNATHSVPRRRADKPTLSTYTFASDSTKLGEIPQRNWTVPFDFEEAARLNAEVAVKGHPVVATSAEHKTRTKKGLRSLFKKQGA